MNSTPQTPIKSIQLVCELGIIAFEAATALESNAYRQLLAFEKANKPIIGKFWYNVILDGSDEFGKTNTIQISGDDCRSTLQSFMTQYENRYEIMPGAGDNFMVSDGSIVIQYNHNLDIIAPTTQAEFDKIKSVLHYTKQIAANNHSHALLKFIVQEASFEKQIIQMLKAQKH